MYTLVGIGIPSSVSIPILKAGLFNIQFLVTLGMGSFPILKVGLLNIPLFVTLGLFP